MVASGKVATTMVKSVLGRRFIVRICPIHEEKPLILHPVLVVQLAVFIIILVLRMKNANLLKLICPSVKPLNNDASPFPYLPFQRFSWWHLQRRGEHLLREGKRTDFVRISDNKKTSLVRFKWYWSFPRLIWFRLERVSQSQDRSDTCSFAWLPSLPDRYLTRYEDKSKRNTKRYVKMGRALASKVFESKWYAVRGVYR
jgi:hypothetical protein